jgi:23S rRNA pseudouridine1911/1915/1917 synthase
MTTTLAATVDSEPSFLLEDGPLLAVNKPAGLLTQGAPVGIPTVEGWVKDQLKTKYAKPGNVYLGIPHRLDRPVSGVIVFARNSKAAQRLAEQFQQRTVRKEYLCITEGIPDQATERWCDWLLKDAAAAHVTVVPPETAGAKAASLTYEVLAAQNGRALVRVHLETGRMHQIRVQFAQRGLPIIGDRQYGARVPFPGENGTGAHPAAIALHAVRLELSHPIRYDRVTLVAPPPPTWGELGLSAEALAQAVRAV